MALTTLSFCLLSIGNWCASQTTTLRILFLALSILAFTILTGCGSEGGPTISDVINLGGTGNGCGWEGDPTISDAINLGGTGNGCGGGGSVAPAGSVFASLAWDPVPDVIGYIVHYGTSTPGSHGSCAYGQSMFSTSPSATVTRLANNTTYYFAVSAYNGLQSACSAEVSTVTGSA